MSISRTLLLMRHAETEDFAPGRPDKDLVLTRHGREQAEAVGQLLRLQGLSIDQVLCSTAIRARQTCEGVGLNSQLESAQVHYVQAIYSSGSEAILGAVREMDSDAVTALVIGHAPGIPSLAHDLANPDCSDSDAVDAVGHRFPPATLVRLEFIGSWHELVSAALVSAHLPAS